MRQKEEQKVDFGFEQLVRLLPGYVYWKDVSGFYLGCNQRFSDFHELASPDDLIGKTDFDILSRKEAQRYMAVDENVLTSGEKYSSVEYAFDRKGRHRDFFTQKVPLLDVHSKVLGVLGVSIDITDLRNRERMLENIIAEMPGHVYWKDEECVLLGCNEEQARDVGLKSRGEIVGKTAYDLIWDDQSEDERQRQAQITDEIDKAIMQSGVSQTIEEFVETPQGTKTYLSTKVPIRDRDDHVAALVGISFDITGRIEMENELKIARDEAEAANRAKTEFLANMSHDVKTPITGFISMAEALSHRLAESDPENAENAKLMWSAGCKALEFFDHCLEISKLENSELSLLTEVFSFKSIIDDVVELFKPAIRSKGLRFNVEYDETIPEELLGSRSSIYRVILNLLSNAIKFTHEGVVTLRALIESTSDDGVVVRVVVEDTGIGIPSDKTEKIFEKLTRLTPSYTGLYEGSGIGLYIVWKFVDALGGTVSVDSVEGKGSSFTVLLPLVIPEAS